VHAGKCIGCTVRYFRAQRTEAFRFSRPPCVARGFAGNVIHKSTSRLQDRYRNVRIIYAPRMPTSRPQNAEHGPSKRPDFAENVGDFPAPFVNNVRPQNAEEHTVPNGGNRRSAPRMPNRIPSPKYRAGKKLVQIVTKMHSHG
jgi:hypothetical protein